MEEQQTTQGFCPAHQWYTQGAAMLEDRLRAIFVVGELDPAFILQHIGDHDRLAL